jgi:hypothetical protein
MLRIGMVTLNVGVVASTAASLVNHFVSTSAKHPYSHWINRGFVFYVAAASLVLGVTFVVYGALLYRRVAGMMAAAATLTFGDAYKLSFDSTATGDMLDEMMINDDDDDFFDESASQGSVSDDGNSNIGSLRSVDFSGDGGVEYGDNDFGSSPPPPPPLPPAALAANEVNVVTMIDSATTVTIVNVTAEAVARQSRIYSDESSGGAGAGGGGDGGSDGGGYSRPLSRVSSTVSMTPARKRNPMLKVCIISTACCICFVVRCALLAVIYRVEKHRRDDLRAHEAARAASDVTHINVLFVVYFAVSELLPIVLMLVALDSSGSAPASSQRRRRSSSNTSALLSDRDSDEQYGAFAGESTDSVLAISATN